MKAVQSGYSLLELIAVMAIMAILAGAMAPNIAERIDAARRDAERQNLAILAQDLKQSILQQKRIPSMRPASWSQAIATVSSYSRERILRNDKGFVRRLLVDPRFFSQEGKPFRGFVQNRGLKQRPYSPRMMLASSLKQALRIPQLSASEFDAIWNQTAQSPLRENNDLIIERINLAPYFHRIVLSNQRSGERPFYQLEAGDKQAVPRASNNRDGSITRYVLHDTRIALHQAPFPSGRRQQTAFVQSDYSMRYQSAGTGGGQPGRGNGDDADKDNGAGSVAVWVKP